MKALKTYILPEFLNTSVSGYMHSIFTHSLNIVFDDTMITIHGDLNAGIPDSIVVPEDDFKILQNLEPGGSIVYDDKQLLLAKRKFSLNIDVDNFPSKTNSCSELAFDSELISRIRLLEDKYFFKYSLPGASEAILSEVLNIFPIDLDRAERLLLPLIGLGQGLTPSVDDALLGVIAVIALLNASGIDMRQYRDFPEMIYRLSKDRTTDVSRKYLRCAVDSRFSLGLNNAVRSLFDAKPFCFSEMSQLIHTGHTSGIDTLKGILLAAINLNRQIA